MRLKSIVEDFYPVRNHLSISIYDSEASDVELCATSIHYPDSGTEIIVTINQESYDYSDVDVLKIAKMAILYSSKIAKKYFGKSDNIFIRFNDNVQDEIIQNLIDSGSISKHGDSYLLGDIKLDKSGDLNDLDKTSYDSGLSQKFVAYSSKSGKGPQNAGDYNLSKAVNFHELNMKGQRWPELELAFIYRSNTYKAKGVSDYTRPRKSLFKYLNNISERWPEGDDMAAATIKKFSGPYFGKTRYFTFTNDVMRYVYSKAPHLMYDIGLGIYKNLYIPWAKNNSLFGYLNFHDIDYSSDSVPPKFIELFKKG